MHCYLELKDGAIFHGKAFGYAGSASGECVFNTGMTGYPETLTDPSYKGQILVLTYPIIGNYGVPPIELRDGLCYGAESAQIQIEGLVVSDYCHEYSHWQANKSLDAWMKEHRIPGIYGVDTRALTKVLRDKGSMLARIAHPDNGPANRPDFIDPNQRNLVAEVSVKEPVRYGNGKKVVGLVDCGAKSTIIHSLLERDVAVLRMPWDYDFNKADIHGLLVSNGPGDPKSCQETIKNLKRAIADYRMPIFGICLGHQLLALAAGTETYKMKFGHRSQNQPCKQIGTDRCFITSQNHGYSVDPKNLSSEWEAWFENANDGTNEGIRHKQKRIRSVQFHPEAFPGPNDTGYLFDEFVKQL